MPSNYNYNTTSSSKLKLNHGIMVTVNLYMYMYIYIYILYIYIRFFGLAGINPATYTDDTSTDIVPVAVSTACKYRRSHSRATVSGKQGGATSTFGISRKFYAGWLNERDQVSTCTYIMIY